MQKHKTPAMPVPSCSLAELKVKIIAFKKENPTQDGKFFSAEKLKASFPIDDVRFMFLQGMIDAAYNGFVRIS